MATRKSIRSISILKIDDPAIVEGDFDSQNLEDQSIQGSVIVDIDGLNDGSYYSIATVDSPKHGTAVIDSFSGEWSYVPDLNYFGADSFAVTVTDDEVATIQDIAVAISPVDDEIVILPSSITEATIKEGTSTGQIKAKDIDGLSNSSVINHQWSSTCSWNRNCGSHSGHMDLYSTSHL